jgi:para-nitrobenzyl esterase
MKLLKTLLLVMLTHYVFGQNNYFSVQTTIEKGIIEGNYDVKTGLQTYFGIPFAKPPVGNLRWKAPQTLAPWKGVKTTKAFGPRPIQKLIWGDMNSRSAGVSEDCLYLNVWTPAKLNTQNLPVLLYYYGGGNIAGDGSEPRYDGETMAQKGIVVVTCNYRLNVFGFMAHPELSAEAPYKASGNYGLLDQVEALRWVVKNIAKFGGDPKKITIAGESAGSISVSLHMASPLSKGYLAGAIGESGGAFKPTVSPISLNEAENRGKAFLEKTNVKTIAQARKLSTREIYETYNDKGPFSFSTVLDKYFLENTASAIFSEGKQAQIPLLCGWNSAEISGQSFMQGQAYTLENYLSRLKADYPSTWQEALKAYPANTPDEVAQAATDLSSDRFINYSTWKWADLHSKTCDKPTYRYLFSKLRPPLVDQTLQAGLAGGTSKANANAPKPPKALGAPHAAEIEYCMGNLRLIKEFSFTDEDHQVSETMNNYFANFIKTGNPNGDKLANWPIVKKGSKTPDYMNLDTESKAVNATTDFRFEFMDKIFSK